MILSLKQASETPVKKLDKVLVSKNGKIKEGVIQVTPISRSPFGDKKFRVDFEKSHDFYFEHELTVIVTQEIP
jgi:hypothetical protein